MAANMRVGKAPLWRRMRWAVWGGAAGVLLLPLLAMQFTREVDWSVFDFIAMGLMLGMVCGAFELAVRVARNNLYIVAAGVATAAGFLMTWINLAVGIIGDEHAAANRLFFGVLAVGLVGTAIARLRAHGMARVMLAMAAAQLAVTAYTAALGESHAFVLSAFFSLSWLVAARLFHASAQRCAMAG